MRTVLYILLLLSFTINAQEENKFKKELKKTFKFSTFYAAVNGGTSISDQNTYSILNGLQTDVIETPFDYTFSFRLSHSHYALTSIIPIDLKVLMLFQKDIHL